MGCPCMASNGLSEGVYCEAWRSVDAELDRHPQGWRWYSFRLGIWQGQCIGEVEGSLDIEIRSKAVYFCSGILLKDILSVAAEAAGNCGKLRAVIEPGQHRRDSEFSQSLCERWKNDCDAFRPSAGAGCFSNWFAHRDSLHRLPSVQAERSGLQPRSKESGSRVSATSTSAPVTSLAKLQGRGRAGRLWIDRRRHVRHHRRFWQTRRTVHGDD